MIFIEELRDDIGVIKANLCLLLVTALNYTIILWEMLKLLLKGESMWGIGFKGFVEIRVGRKAPKPIKTFFEKDGERRVYTPYITRNGHWSTKSVKVPHKISLANTIHTGGRTLRAFTSRDFWRITHINLPRGEIIKLTKAQTSRVLAKR